MKNTKKQQEQTSKSSPREAEKQNACADSDTWNHLIKNLGLAALAGLSLLTEVQRLQPADLAHLAAESWSLSS